MKIEEYIKFKRAHKRMIQTAPKHLHLGTGKLSVHLHKNCTIVPEKTTTEKREPVL